MNPLRNVGARLGLGLAIVVAAALLLVGLIVVPSLEHNLVDAKLGQLRNAAPRIGHQLVSAPPETLDEVIQSAAADANARVVYFHFLGADQLTVFADSNPVTVADVESDPLVPRAWREDRMISGTVTDRGERFAEVAYPLALGPVVLLRASLADSLQSVHLVRRRLLIGGLIALAAALLVGYVAASLFARRVRRLERAADRIAGGDLNEPVADPGKDEVGELAAAFERMRQRLLQLEHARREFIANASHELRTPLFSLAGFLELMDEEDLDAATRADFIASMREQIDRLTKLATELLDLSRLDAGRLRVEEEPVDLGRLAATLADEFRAVARSSGHQLDVGSSANAVALGDAERALQIGRVLVENAIRHTPAGTPVHLGTARRDGSVLLTVEDEGPGIPSEHADHVFDRFYRVEGSVASGSGLGLAIARELAELMGGSVELDSAGGRTRFALVLPATAERLDGRPFSRENAEAGEATEPLVR